MSLALMGYIWRNGRDDASSKWYWMEREEFEDHPGPQREVPRHFIPLVTEKSARDTIDKLRAQLAPYLAEEERRKRESGDYWLTPEGRAKLKETFDDREDGNAVRPLLDRVELLEDKIRNLAVFASPDCCDEE